MHTLRPKSSLHPIYEQQSVFPYNGTTLPRPRRTTSPPDPKTSATPKNAATTATKYQQLQPAPEYPPDATPSQHSWRETVLNSRPSAENHHEHGRNLRQIPQLPTPSSKPTQPPSLDSRRSADRWAPKESEPRQPKESNGTSIFRNLLRQFESGLRFVQPSSNRPQSTPPTPHHKRAQSATMPEVPVGRPEGKQRHASGSISSIQRSHVSPHPMQLLCERNIPSHHHNNNIPVATSTPQKMDKLRIHQSTGKYFRN